MSIKKITSLILVIVILTASTICYADYTDVPTNAVYSDAIKKMSKLGIITGIDNGQYKPNMILSREQFIIILITALGLADQAEVSKSQTDFSDVEQQSFSKGYINLAVEKQIIKKAPDGKFHPLDNITMADACTMLVRALGYNDEMIKGTSPDNFVKKAEELGLLEGINIGKKNDLQKWSVAMMINKLWIINTKSRSYADLDRDFSVSSVFDTEYLILGNSLVSDGLTPNQVLTDKGILYVNNPEIKLEVGNKYKLITDGENILKASGELKSLEKITLVSAIDTNVTYMLKDKVNKLTLPDKPSYYYHGKIITYEELKGILGCNTSIVFAWNKDKTGYEYGIIFDAIYSKPEVSNDFNPSVKKLGDIILSANQNVFRNSFDNNTTPVTHTLGEASNISEIKSGDIVYQVSDIWGGNKYLLVVDNKVEGKITSILPNRASAKTIQIDGKDFDFGKYMNVGEIRNSAVNFKIGDRIVLLLGFDGKVAAIKYTESSNQLNYAFVLNYTKSISKAIKDRGIETYTVKLLLDSGITETFKINYNPEYFKGKLVSYTKSDNETVVLSEITYNHPGEINIKKDGRQINSSYIADDIKIFNFITNHPDEDCKVNLLKWSEMPYGIINSGKIMYMNYAGLFNDVNILLIYDVYNRFYQTAIVSKFNGGIDQNPNNDPEKEKGIIYNHTVLIDGKEYSLTTKSRRYTPGTVFRVTSDNTSCSVIEGMNEQTSAKKVQAIDTKRIKINDTIYYYKDNMTVYFMDAFGNITVKGTNAIDINRTYDNVLIYMDKVPENDGKVEAIVVKEP